MFLSDDGNTAVFPMPSGDFPVDEMTSRTHFEVNGNGIAAIPTVSQSPGDNAWVGPSPSSPAARDIIVHFVIKAPKLAHL